MNLKAFLVGLLAFGLLISPISSIETTEEGREEHWGNYEKDEDSEAIFRSVEAPFKRRGKYVKVEARGVPTDKDWTDVIKDDTLSASFKWAYFKNFPSGEIINGSPQPITYLLHDSVNRRYLVKDLEAGKREVLYVPSSFGTNKVSLAIIPQSEQNIPSSRTLINFGI
ncbi:hypothetical protein PCANC_12063 [Puccinia coronata f. sp. avenae]|uniref:Uncharacterized protein n=1 Tax=Puccinia coronata f. sp. avenae TaxID=200324 RepID=A0A2N5T3J7_9BASI|nr:hypothetical protein PCANC_12063 [Puccinia coronata f. sp. avenae]